MRVNESSAGIDSMYVGETSKSGFVRGKQHLESLNNPGRTDAKSNAFVRHREIYHKYNEEEVEFQFDIVRAFKKPLERQICEGVEIHSSKCDIKMNSKLDHHQPAIGRMMMDFGL